ncbi:hypothetical protein Anae109_3148 [Anaeromyxobacter sp. Fw109-5]|nr:hypothetical protein Anae109_3148 [Anaeromyxobacter sp. Fw109-5]
MRPRSARRARLLRRRVGPARRTGVARRPDAARVARGPHRAGRAARRGRARPAGSRGSVPAGAARVVRPFLRLRRGAPLASYLACSRLTRTLRTGERACQQHGAQQREATFAYRHGSLPRAHLERNLSRLGGGGGPYGE